MQIEKKSNQSDHDPIPNGQNGPLVAGWNFGQKRPNMPSRQIIRWGGVSASHIFLHLSRISLSLSLTLSLSPLLKPSNLFHLLRDFWAKLLDSYDSAWPVQFDASLTAPSLKTGQFSKMAALQGNAKLYRIGPTSLDRFATKQQNCANHSQPALKLTL